MKNLAFILALSTAVFTMISCQKENITPVASPIPQAQVAAAEEDWILLEQTWSITVTPGNPAIFTAQNPSGGQLSGSAISINQLPPAVTNAMNALGVAIPANAIVWAVAGGGYVLQVPTTGFATRVFWFNAQNSIKSIGSVIA